MHTCVCARAAYLLVLALAVSGSEELRSGRADAPGLPETASPLVRLEESVADRAPVEEVAFYRLLAEATQLPDETWQRPAPLVRAAELTSSPHFYRGRMVEVVGAVVELSPWELPGNPSGLRRLFRVFLIDPEEQLTAVALLRDPGSWDRGDGVRVRGIFFKVWRFRSRGGDWEEAPLLVGQEFVSAPTGAREDRGAPALMKLAMAVGMAFVLLLVLRSWMSLSRTPIKFRIGGRRRSDGEGTGSRRSG